MANLETFDALLEFKFSAVGGTTTITASGNTDGIDLQASLSPTNPWNDSNKNTLEIVVNITAHSGSPTTTFAVTVDSAVGFGSEVTYMSRVMAANETGRIVFILDLATVTKIKAAARYIRLKVTIAGGASPSLTYRAYIRKPRGLVGG